MLPDSMRHGCLYPDLKQRDLDQRGSHSSPDGGHLYGSERSDPRTSGRVDYLIRCQQTMDMILRFLLVRHAKCGENDVELVRFDTVLLPSSLRMIEK